MPHLAARAALLLSLSVFAACGGESRGRADNSAPSAAAAIEPHTVSGEWKDGDESSTWTASTIVQHALRIDEQARFGEDAHVTRMMVFDSTDYLVSILDSREQTAQSGNASPAPMRSQLVLEFANDSAIRMTKTVDGADRPVQPYEIANARRHAEQLLAQVRQRAPKS